MTRRQPKRSDGWKKNKFATVPNWAGHAEIDGGFKEGVTSEEKNDNGISTVTFAPVSLSNLTMALYTGRMRFNLVGAKYGAHSS
jgi:hypothetical protein